MPELPEVETIKNALEPSLVGRTFVSVRITDKRPVQRLSLDEFCSGLAGRTITGISRRGKYLIIGLSGGSNLIIHLRMTGALLWNPAEEEPFKRLEFFFDGGGHLIYTDVRRFGTMYLVTDPNEIVGKLGIEPLNGGFTAKALAGLLKSRTTPIKSALLNQEHIAGIGNMYADEALFKAKIHPLRPAKSLTPAEIRALHGAIREVLKKGIRNHGASIRNYRSPDGKTGTAHEEFAVAHREDQPCPACGAPVARIVVGQRGSYFCRRCQHYRK
jgi:formamidopyrimidine-DNA glycosylase